MERRLLLGCGLLALALGAYALGARLAPGQALTAAAGIGTALRTPSHGTKAHVGEKTSAGLRNRADIIAPLADSLPAAQIDDPAECARAHCARRAYAQQLPIEVGEPELNQVEPSCLLAFGVQFAKVQMQKDKKMLPADEVDELGRALLLAFLPYLGFHGVNVIVQQNHYGDPHFGGKWIALAIGPEQLDRFLAAFVAMAERGLVEGPESTVPVLHGAVWGTMELLQATRMADLEIVRRVQKSCYTILERKDCFYCEHLTAGCIHGMGHGAYYLATAAKAPDAVAWQLMQPRYERAFGLCGMLSDRQDGYGCAGGLVHQASKIPKTFVYKFAEPCGTAPDFAYPCFQRWFQSEYVKHVGPETRFKCVPDFCEPQDKCLVPTSPPPSVQTVQGCEYALAGYKVGKAAIKPIEVVLPRAVKACARVRQQVQRMQEQLGHRQTPMAQIQRDKRQLQDMTAYLNACVVGAIHGAGVPLLTREPTPKSKAAAQCAQHFASHGRVACELALTNGAPITEPWVLQLLDDPHADLPAP